MFGVNLICVYFIMYEMLSFLGFCFNLYLDKLSVFCYLFGVIGFFKDFKIGRVFLVEIGNDGIWGIWVLGLFMDSFLVFVLFVYLGVKGLLIFLNIDFCCILFGGNYCELG